MALGSDTQTHRHTHIKTRGSKQFQETRRVRPKATRPWFKNQLNCIDTDVIILPLLTTAKSSVENLQIEFEDK